MSATETNNATITLNGTEYAAGIFVFKHLECINEDGGYWNKHEMTRQATVADVKCATEEYGLYEWRNRYVYDIQDAEEVAYHKCYLTRFKVFTSSFWENVVYRAKYPR